MNSILSKYAKLLINYCLEIKPGESIYIKTTTLAEPLVRELYREALKAGAYHVEVDMSFPGRNRIFLQEANEEQLKQVSPSYQRAVESFQAYLVVRAPFNLKEDQGNDQEKIKAYKNSHKWLNELYFKRTANRELKRNLCQYPTQAAAQNAGMSLEEYQQFVFGACNLLSDDPMSEWLKVREKQQRIVDHLNKTTKVEYKGNGIDISFQTKGRTWINSDGKTNMPSGEVYTSPEENSVNGVINFSYPGLYMGNEVEDVTLWVKDGYIEKWEAKLGKDFLDKIFSLDGARRFGEAAIGTNYNIKQMTKNILFDEKIGGTIHMAIGQSYLQCGGQNKSSIHWDMISDMTDGGTILADGEKIYENGLFII